MFVVPSDVLVSLPASETPLLLHIHTLCDAWWQKGLKEKEQFGRTAFLLSLQKSFTLKKPVSICPVVHQINLMGLFLWPSGHHSVFSPGSFVMFLL